ncbi:MAG: nucleotide exchange factor GrpE [Candidatus Yonathbacteria bacterium RIFCSPHIGHO2_01_FULL_44_41]|uniref:Protein GrpE n=1 Tax=Candidatus Yonathbacteria bacterium RIFCSPHIGHO2_02_FULL_44_14 TaxID=1802724 RepID=A0A1G2S8Z5_9BACT|nr:MAG: nucleotide exchange factor GrpE [Candidatus Yonathbacteria bacterium RIFCSPHIGHO2_01_FULL_44_41]OHA81580.1 MAG: nucleotide exchange factor GrpE [Candidatus Yonathbacteria bacterium RIFCSPHIGHO2_02_FULL_44_14]OHA81761.1 MAG: nucleotide exchange factor GrpE [Candidatus Yonathbacteria bacterium RIFCSPLOWO2_01_FULL_43_20]
MTNTENDDKIKDAEAQDGPLDTREDALYSEDLQFESEEDLESPALALKKLREKLRSCEKEKKEYLDGWQRMRADFANVRKDEETRRGEMIKFASEGLVDDLLPVLDSFTMAFSNKEAWEKVDANWRKGVEYIYAQMYSVLESRGLTSIGEIGEQTDPRLHVAIEEVPATRDEEVGTVSEVIQKGYRLHSKVIRPAKVKSFGSIV